MAADMEQTKKATRDYPALSSTPWTLWDVMYARRSVRKYESFPEDEALINSLREFLAFALEACGSPADSIRFISDPEAGQRTAEAFRQGCDEQDQPLDGQRPIAGLSGHHLPRDGDQGGPAGASGQNGCWQRRTWCSG